MKLHLDFETYSDADLKKVGVVNYACHPSTRVILAAWTFLGEEYQYDIRDTHSHSLSLLFEHLKAAYTVHAWNASFERAILRYVLGVDLPLKKWRCVMSHALYRSLPASLADAAEALGVEGKTTNSQRLLRLFCMPPSEKVKLKETPEDWPRFCAYNRQDVRAEIAVEKALMDANLYWPEHEIDIYHLTEKINDRGIPVDLSRARAAISTHIDLKDAALARMREVTGVENPASVVQLGEWLAKRGLPTLSLDAESVRALLKKTEDGTPEREALELRADIALTAPQKYVVALEQASEGRLHHLLQYSGAGRTHRWSGRGFQPQNVRRGLSSEEEIDTAWEIISEGDTEFLRMMYGDPFKLLADLVRSIIREKDQPLVVADYASIEVIMLYWAAGDTKKMQEFAKGLDPYKVFASVQFGVPYEEVTKKQRTFAKPPVLGGGYGLGPDTLIEYASGMGVEMTHEEARKAIIVYRDQHPLVVDLWKGLETAMSDAITTKKAYRYGRFLFRPVGGHVECVLPSGSSITYMQPEIRKVRRVRKPPAEIRENKEALSAWNANPDHQYDADVITYMGVNQRTRAWSRIPTWGGKLTENVVQSISRDVLAHGLEEAEKAGLKPILHVHDEIVVPAGKDPEKRLESLRKAMSAPPWCADAPIRAEGFVTSSYRKD